MKKAITLSVMLYMILLSFWCLSIQVSAENVYGFTMPIDGLDLERDINTPFGNGHRGIDTYKGGYGTTIKAVQSGTIVAQANLPHNHASSSSVDSWGTYVRIIHGTIQGVKVETLLHLIALMRKMKLKLRFIDDRKVHMKTLTTRL